MYVSHMTDAEKVKARDDALAVIREWQSLYTRIDGREFFGMRPAEVGSGLARKGWSGASSWDASDFRSLGMTVAEGMYIGGARPTGRYIDVVVFREREGPRHFTGSLQPRFPFSKRAPIIHLKAGPRGTLACRPTVSPDLRRTRGKPARATYAPEHVTCEHCKAFMRRSNAAAREEKAS